MGRFRGILSFILLVYLLVPLPSFAISVDCDFEKLAALEHNQTTAQRWARRLSPVGFVDVWLTAFTTPIKARTLRDVYMNQPHAWEALRGNIISRRKNNLPMDLLVFTSVRSVPFAQRAKAFFSILNDYEKSGLLQYFRVMLPNPKVKIKTKKISTDPVVDDFQKHPHVIARAIEAIKQYGTSAQGSFALNGRLKVHQDLENKISEYNGKEDSLLLASGSFAQGGWVEALTIKGDLVLHSDHSSKFLKDNMQNARPWQPLRRNGTPPTYYEKQVKHNDITGIANDIEAFYSRPENKGRNVFVSLPEKSYKDGSLVDLQALDALAKKYPDTVQFVIDRSLTVGGVRNAAADRIISENPNFIVVTSFNEKLGSDLGAVSGGKDIVKMGRYLTDRHLFSAAPSPPDTGAALGQIELILARDAGQKTIESPDIKPIEKPTEMKYEPPTGEHNRWESAGSDDILEGDMYSSNSYHSNHRRTYVKEYAQWALENYGLAQGKTLIHEQLEANLKGFVGHDDIELTATGFGAAQAVARLAQPGELAVFDEKSHASTASGLKGFAKENKDIADAVKKLRDYVTSHGTDLDRARVLKQLLTETEAGLKDEPNNHSLEKRREQLIELEQELRMNRKFSKRLKPLLDEVNSLVNEINDGPTHAKALEELIEKETDPKLRKKLKKLQENMNANQFYARSFKHNNVEQLKRRVKNFRSQPGNENKRVFILVESIYSMKGTMAPIDKIMKEIVEKDPNVVLVIDGAHDVGVLGNKKQNKGQGALSYFGLRHHPQVLFAGTLSKTLGSKGGYILGSKKLLDELRDKEDGKLPPLSLPNAASALASLNFMMTHGEAVVKQLHDITNYAKKKFEEAGIYVNWDSLGPILPIIPAKKTFKGNKMEQRMNRRGIFLSVPGYPAEKYPFGRVGMSFDITKEQIDRMVEEFLYFRKHLKPVGSPTDEPE